MPLLQLQQIDASVDWLFCIKFWTKMWRCRWISWIWFCVIDLSEDPLLNKDLRYLVVYPVSEILCCINYYWVELITRLHHLISFGIILQKPSVCCIMPVGVHTPLPKYPSGDWQLLSRSRSRQNLQRCNTMGRHAHTASEGCLSDGVWAAVDGWSSRVLAPCNLQQNA